MPTVLGLREDMEKSKSKNMDDDFGNWITDLLKSCIRDYALFDNIKNFVPAHQRQADMHTGHNDGFRAHVFVCKKRPQHHDVL